MGSQIYLSIYLSAHLSTSRTIYLFIYLATYLVIRVSSYVPTNPCTNLRQRWRPAQAGTLPEPSRPESQERHPIKKGYGEGYENCVAPGPIRRRSPAGASPNPHSCGREGLRTPLSPQPRSTYPNSCRHRRSHCPNSWHTQRHVLPTLSWLPVALPR